MTTEPAAQPRDVSVRLVDDLCEAKYWHTLRTGRVIQRDYDTARATLLAHIAGIKAANARPVGEPRQFYDALNAGHFEYSAMSWSGFNVFGDEKSIKEVRRATHYAAQIEQYRMAFAERLAAKDAEIERLEKLLTESTNARFRP